MGRYFSFEGVIIDRHDVVFDAAGFPDGFILPRSALGYVLENHRLGEREDARNDRAVDRRFGTFPLETVTTESPRAISHYQRRQTPVRMKIFVLCKRWL